MRRALLLLIMVATVLVPSGNAFACSCGDTTSDSDATRDSEIVFAGTLVEERFPLLSSDERTIRYLFEVDTVVKGDVGETTVMNNFVQDGNSCSEELTVGKRYLVFSDDPEDLNVQTCSPTHAIGDEEIEGRAPSAGGSTLPPSPLKVVLIVVVVLGLVGFVLARKFRDPLKH